MFEQIATEAAEPAALIERIGAAARSENRAVAAQLIAIGELLAYRRSRSVETEDRAIDTMEEVAAEIAAALRISQRLAASRVESARAMARRAEQAAHAGPAPPDDDPPPF